MSEDFLPIISVIILNYNGKKFLNDCLSSLANQTYKNLENIFVDNGSTDDSINFVKNTFPGFLIIDNKINLGFAEGNNRGIKIARGDYIFVLNNDTVLQNDCIEKLVDFAKNNQAVGMLAPKILSINNKNLIDSVGINIYPDGLGRGRKRNEIDSGHKNQEEILCPSGCAAFYKKKMLNEVGDFDADFFAYCEDMDLGLRGRLANWKSFSVPSAIVYHHYSGTSGKFSPFKAFLAERNHFFVAIKNFPVSLLLQLPFFTFKRYLYIAFGLSKKQGPAAKFSQSKLGLIFILLKAYCSFFYLLPKMIFKRTKIQKSKKISNNEFIGLIKKYSLPVWEVTLKE